MSFGGQYFSGYIQKHAKNNNRDFYKELKNFQQTSSPTRINPAQLVSLSEIKPQSIDRFHTDTLSSVDRVLGGGLVPGSVILLGGEPGTGKSTLLLQYANSLTHSHIVYYFSGEESEEQIYMRAQRLGLTGNSKLYISNISYINEALINIEQSQSDALPTLVIIDSIQTVRDSSNQSKSGSISQVQAVVQKLVQFAKTKKVAFLLVGHVTKEGSLAGPKTVEHLVDVVLYLEGDIEKKILRCGKGHRAKNAFPWYSKRPGPSPIPEN